MEALVETRWLTVDEFWELGEAADHCELVRGEVVKMAPTSDEHGTAAMALMSAIHVFAKANGLGRCHVAETGFVVRRDPDTVRAPDGAFTATARLAPRTKRFVTTIPNLVLEVVSPSDRPSAVSAKVGEWLEAGVDVVVVVWPDLRSVVLHRAGGGQVVTLGPDDVLTVPELLPGFELPVHEIFE